MSSVFSDALTSLSLIEQEYEGIEVVSALPNEGYDVRGVLGDTIDISFRIIGRPGLLTVSVPYTINWNAVAFFAIGEKAQQVELIYEGATDGTQVPTVLLVPAPNEAVTLIPLPGETTPL